MADDDPDAGKRDKTSVDYSPAKGADRCGTCRYSYGPMDDRRCKRVKGRIDPYYWCLLFEAK